MRYPRLMFIYSLEWFRRRLYLHDMKNIEILKSFQVWLFMGLGLTLMACSQPETKNAEAGHHSEGHDHAEGPRHGKAVKPETPGVQASASHARSAESHVHGGAVLSIVSENNTILVELETPLFNLLGFEYAPNTPEERARVMEVESRLAQPQSLIKFNAEAKCSFDAPQIKPTLFETEDNHMGHDDDHADDDHADDDHEDETSNHKDIVLNYALRCDAINKLKNVQVEFFQHFQNFTDLELVYLGPTRQMSAELSRSRPIADLTR